MLLLAASLITYMFFTNLHNLDVYVEGLLKAEQHLDKFELLP